MPVSASCSSRKRFSRSLLGGPRHPGVDPPPCRPHHAGEHEDQPARSCSASEPVEHPAAPGRRRPPPRAGRARRSGRAAAGCGSRTVAQRLRLRAAGHAGAWSAAAATAPIGPSRGARPGVSASRRVVQRRQPVEIPGEPCRGRAGRRSPSGSAASRSSATTTAARRRRLAHAQPSPARQRPPGGRAPAQHQRVPVASTASAGQHRTSRSPAQTGGPALRRQRRAGFAGHGADTLSGGAPQALSLRRGQGDLPRHSRRIVATLRGYSALKSKSAGSSRWLGFAWVSARNRICRRPGLACLPARRASRLICRRCSPSWLPQRSHGMIG